MTKNTSLFITRGAGLIILFLGACYMGALLFHSVPLIQLAPDYASLKFNTVLSFLCVGLGLIALSINYQKLALFTGFIIFVISGLTVSEYGLNIDLGIDQLFFTPYIDADKHYPGRMAALIAWGLLLSSLVLMGGTYLSSKWYCFLTRLFAALILIMGIVPLIGYIMSVKIAYTFGLYTAISLQSAIVFIAIGIGLNAYAWQGNVFVERSDVIFWVSLLVSSVLILFSIIVWQQGLQREDKLVHERLQEETRLIKLRISDNMNYSIKALQRMAARWELRDDTPENEWRLDASNYLEDTPALRMIGVINNNYQIMWEEPLSTNQTILNQYLLEEKNKQFIEHKQFNTSLSSSFGFPGNKYKGVIALTPIYSKQQLQGLIAGIFDIERLIKESVTPGTGNLFNIELKEVGDGLLFSSIKSKEAHEYYNLNFKLFNKVWLLRVQPRQEFINQNSSLLPYLELMVGILLSFLVGSTLYYALTAAQRNKQLVEKSVALARSEKRQNQLVNDVHDYAIFWLDLNGDVETWNSGAKRIYGYSSKEIVNRNFSIFFTEEEVKNALPLKVLNKAKVNEKFEGEAEYIRKDKTKFWASVIVETIKNNNKELIGFAMVVRDITQQRSLEIERTKLISIIDESPEFIGTADMQGNLLYHNRSARRICGLPEDADLSLMKIANMHPDWAFNLILNEALPYVLKVGSWTSETALLHQVTGEEIPVLQTIFLHRDPLGHPLCFVTVMQNITERKKIEEALKNSEAIFRSSMENAPIGMALLSIKGEWLKVNRSLCDMVDYTEEELLNTDYRDMTHPEDLDNDREQIKQILHDEIETYNVEKRYFHKNGHIIWTLVSVTIARHSDGKPNYFIVQIQNITDRKNAEVAQQKLIAQLAHSNMELERFAYVASHDMQEPLRMVVCFSDILSKDFSNLLNDEAKKYLDIVNDSGQRMQEMIQDLLEYSRACNEVELFKSVDGNTALEYALDNINDFIEEKKAEITYDKLPNFVGNPMQFMRLLQNLITNSLKYQPKDSIPRVHVGVKDMGKDWCISVQDNGLGIPHEFSEQIFQPFRRLHTWDKIKGTGLGLSICKKIVESHGGTLWVEPAPKRGSIFYFTLPKAHSSETL